MRIGTSCIVEQFGLAMIPGWPSRSPGLTWLTTRGIVGSIRQALELSITVAPRAAAWGASSRETSPPAEKRAMSTPSKASPVASTISWLTLDRNRASGRSTGRHEAQLPEGKLPLGEDLDHRPPDDAGGADDRDGERLACHIGHGSAVSVTGPGTAGV